MSVPALSAQDWVIVGCVTGVVALVLGLVMWRPDATACHAALRDELPAWARAEYRALDEIVPGLLLGNECAAAAAVAGDLRVTALLTMSMEHDFGTDVPYHLVTYRRLPLADNDNGGRVAHVRASLDAAADFIHTHRRVPGGRVLVHCQMGISRSTSAIIAYLLKYGGVASYNEALLLVRQRRYAAAPNDHFRAILETFVNTDV
jgi:dual specificity phosphatase 12